MSDRTSFTSEGGKTFCWGICAYEMDAMPAAISLPATVAIACSAPLASPAGGVTWKVSSCWSSMAARRKGCERGSGLPPGGTARRRSPWASAAPPREGRFALRAGEPDGAVDAAVADEDDVVVGGEPTGVRELH